MSFLRSIRTRKPSASKRPTSPLRMKRLPLASCHSRFGGPLGPLVVSVHDRGRMPDDLADLALRHFLAGLVDEANVVVRRRLADGVELVGMEMGRQDAGAAAFGQAVVLGEAAGPALQHVGLDVCRERRAGRQLHDEAREVVAVEIRHGHDPPVLHRHQHGVGGAVPFRQLQKAIRVEFLHQDGGARRSRAWAGSSPAWCSNRAAWRRSSPMRRCSHWRWRA